MTRTARIAAAVARQLGMPGLADALVRASGSQLRPLLMHAMAKRARQVQPPDLRRAHARRALFAPSAVSPRLFHQVDALAFEAAGQAFEPVDLSPVSPLGTNAALGGIDQNNVLSTIADAEVNADPTSAMAYVCAARRARRLARDRTDAAAVSLCTSTRLVRLQPLEVPGFAPHFRLFALATAGRDLGAERFELAALRDHLGVYLRLLDALAGAGFDIGTVTVELSDPRLTERLARAAGIDLDAVLASVRAHLPADHAALFGEHGITVPALVIEPQRQLAALAAKYALERELARLERVRAEVLAPLAGAHPTARFGFSLTRLEGLRYYMSYCFRIRIGGAQHAALGDGGFTQWTARLLGNRKERLLASGIGVELLCKLCAPRSGG